MLDAVTGDYSLVAARGGGFKVEARIEDRIGTATAESKSLAICAAVAQLLGLEIDQNPNELSRVRR